MKNKINIYNTIFKMKNYLLAFIIIFIFDNFLCTSYVNNQIGTICNTALCVFSVLYFLVVLINNRIEIKSISLLLIVTLAIILSFIVNDSPISASLMKISVILFAFCYSKNHTIKDFYYYAKPLMYLIIIETLILNILYFIGVDMSFLPMLENTKGIKLYNGIFSYLFNPSASILRFTGIFWEPGVYAAYLCVFIFFELFIGKSKNRLFLILCVISLIFTFSTTGYICVGLLFIALLFNNRTMKVRNKILLLSVLFIGIITVITNETLFNALFEKILNPGESFGDRLYSIGGNFLAIKENPLLGVGTIKSAEIVKQYIMQQGLLKSYSNLNTILANFSVFGLIPGLYFCFALTKYSFAIKASMISKVIVLLVFVFMLSSTNYVFSLFFNVIFFLPYNLNTSNAKRVYKI